MVIGFDGSRAFGVEKTGTENYAYHLLKALAKIDRKNIYVVYLRPGSMVGKWPRNFQFSILNFQFLWTQVGLAVQTFKDSLDVLFIPAHTLPLLHKPGLKTIVTVHDLGVEYLPKMHQLKQRLYLKWITNFQLKNATKLIAVSKATKVDLIKKIGINPNNVTVIYEGYHKDVFRYVSAKGRLSFGQNSLTPYFLFVGTIQPRKNLERIIKAFALVAARKVQDDFATPNLVIAGSKGWLSEEIYELPKKLGIEDKVKFLGYVPDEKMAVLYSGAVALVFPSLFEGFGLPILEAQACGCPVITSNVSSMPEVAGKGGAILVNPYEVDDIVKGMRRVRESESQRVKLIKNGFENIKRFSWEKCARETLKLFENL